MGTFSKGILGGFSGKVGNVVGARWRGKDIMRSLPTRGTYIPTAAQLDQRERFKTAIMFLTPIKEILSACFGKPQGDKSTFNLATGYHIKYALLPDGFGSYAMDYPKVLIGKGDLRGLSDGSVVADINQRINVFWDDNSGQGNASATDELVVVVYCEALNVFETVMAAGTRNLTTVQIPLPAYWSAQAVDVWATFISADRKLAATSIYLDAVTLT